MPTVKTARGSNPVKIVMFKPSVYFRHRGLTLQSQCASQAFLIADGHGAYQLTATPHFAIARAPAHEDAVPVSRRDI